MPVSDSTITKRRSLKNHWGQVRLLGFQNMTVYVKVKVRTKKEQG